MGAEYQIQKAIFDKLVADAPLIALLAKSTVNKTKPTIYDNVPQVADSGKDADFPYVTIGEDTAFDWDTGTSVGKEATLTVHSWSRDRGRKEVKEIQGAIYDALHLANLVVTGYTTVFIISEFSETLSDPDGITRHGIQRFRLIIDKEE